MRALLIVLVACSDRSPPKPAPPPPTELRAVASPEEPGGIAAASRDSRPRAEWPCGERYTTPKGEQRTRRLAYGTLDACKVPLGLLHLTLGGCPVANAAFPDKTIAYDQRGRLVHGLHDYAWGTTGLLRRKLVPYAERDGRVSLEATPREVYVTDPQGRLTAIEIHDDTGKLAATELDYEGERIVRVREVRRGKTATTDVLYSCGE